MQVTNNTTTIDLNEERLLNLIIDNRIVALEKIFTKKYNCKFLELSEKPRDVFFFLCRAVLIITPGDLADIYDFSAEKITRITEAVNVKWQINVEYRKYITDFYFEFKKIKTAA